MNDIFISYAHLDDQALDEDQKGWISKFHRVLEIKLSQLLGESPKIWRDQKLSGSDVYDDKIVNEFRNAQVMISILSPRYIKSEWCNRELHEFYKVAEDGTGVRIGDKSRIIKVVKTPFETNDEPNEIRSVFTSILGFEFFEVDPDTGHVQVINYVIVHDSGRLINPTIVEGQITGGATHGLGCALFERMIYDDQGQPQTTNFGEYLLPSAPEVPYYEIVL